MESEADGPTKLNLLTELSLMGPNVTKDDVLSKCRDRNLVNARHSLRYLLYQDKILYLLFPMLH